MSAFFVALGLHLCLVEPTEYIFVGYARNPTKHNYVYPRTCLSILKNLNSCEITPILHVWMTWPNKLSALGWLLSFSLATQRLARRKLQLPSTRNNPTTHNQSLHTFHEPRPNYYLILEKPRKRDKQTTQPTPRHGVSSAARPMS